MRLVILESPFRAATEAGHQANLAYARACLRDCLARGESPIASHLLLTQPGVLDDADPADRDRGIAAGHAWMAVADAAVAYTDHGISDGMRRGMDLARQIGLPVEMRTLKDAE